MNLKKKEQIKVLEYWRAFESFVMPSIEHSKTPLGVEQKPIVLQPNSPLPWPLLRNVVESKREESRFVFNIYVGLIEQTIINDKIQKILKATDIDYDLNPSRALTCLAGFVLDDQGCLLAKSYITPDFVKSLYALEKFDEKSEWIANFEKSKKKFELIGTTFSSQKISMLTFEEIELHLKELLTLFDYLSEDEIKFPVVIHIKKIVAPAKLTELEVNEFLDNFETEEKFTDKKQNENDNEEDENTNKGETCLDILPSFFIDDLGGVINSIQKADCGEALQEYLSDQPLTEKKDVYLDRTVSKTLVGPQKLPAANWPDSMGNTLSFAQQMAVNVAVSKKKGLFSVNGPPGTGKTTLLRDIVSEVLVRRAETLVAFKHPLDAFGESVLTKVDFHLKTTDLDERLYGHELVVAASNNNAAENISKELPTAKVIDQKTLDEHKDNWYFPEVAEHYFDDQGKYWGMVSAALGSKKNNKIFFDKFWDKNNKSSMRYLLDRWTFHHEDFEELVEAKIFEKEEEYKWINSCFANLERKILPKWKKEKKEFKKLLSAFKKLQKEYDEIDNLFTTLKSIDAQIKKLKEKLATDRENEQSCRSLMNGLNNSHGRLQIEIGELEVQLGKMKELFSLYEKYRKIKNALDDEREKLDVQKTKVHKLEQESDELKRNLDLSIQILNDLDKEKEDLLQIKPNWFFQVFFLKSKQVKIWHQHFTQLIADSMSERAKIRNIKAQILRLNNQLRDESLLFNRQESVFKNKQTAYQQAKENLHLSGDELEIECLSSKIVKSEKDFLNKQSDAKKIFTEIESIKDKLSNIQAAINSHTNTVSDLECDKRLMLDKIAIIQSRYFGDRKGNFPDPNYWKQNNVDLQLSSPWMSKKMQDIRTHLFWSAVRLHKYFIILARKPLRTNITALKQLLQNNELPKDHHSHIRTLWVSLFLVVPVISSTFASVQRLFRHLKQEELGWLLIDEAGQTPSHYAVGAIWRSCRAIVVGDPLQVEPIVTLPKILSRKLYEYYHVKPIYDVVAQSVQTLADISNPFGTFIGEDDEKIWVGSPLIVHRRCMDPMFAVANKIAYSGLMIQATVPVSSEIDCYYNKSLWISPRKAYAIDPNSHWIEAEGGIACYIIGVLIKNLAVLPSIYVITPFISVKQNLIKYIHDNYIDKWQVFLGEKEAKTLRSRLYKMIGTIHAFQGKQADAVILLLGGNIRKRGAIEWASEKPNILNVAITRAKKLLYVIGSLKEWGDQPYFSELSASMEVVYDGDNFKSKSFSKDKLTLPSLLQEEDLNRLNASQTNSDSSVPVPTDLIW